MLVYISDSQCIYRIVRLQQPWRTWRKKEWRRVSLLSWTLFPFDICMKALSNYLCSKSWYSSSFFALPKPSISIDLALFSTARGITAMLEVINHLSIISSSFTIHLLDEISYNFVSRISRRNSRIFTNVFVYVI